MNKNLTIIISVIVLAIIIIGGYYLFMQPKQNQTQNTQEQTQTNFDIQGMKVEILQQGTGEGAKNGDTVTVNYTGTLPDGTKFDSSLNPSRTPFELTLPGQVIQGWNLGLVGMKVGEKRKLTIPPELGYGAQAVGGVIPANSTLIFEIDMLKVN
jgi:FKBP-type peptidyl-prolyl cis-trans isomerase